MSDQQVYSATYSGVPVFEFITPKTSVMRRQQDGWINATHILKVADFPKAKRTRILERDVQTGVHEKIQGGYGKYQGTWVPLERAREIAQQFGVDRELAAIFDYAPAEGDPLPPPAPKHHHASALRSVPGKNGDGAPKPALKRTNSKLQGIVGGATPLARKRGRPPKSRENSIIDDRTAKLVRSTGPGIAPSRQEQYRSIQQHRQPRLLYNDYDADDASSMSAFEQHNGNDNFSSSPSDFMSDTDLDNALRSSHHETSGQTALRQSTHQSQATPSRSMLSKGDEPGWYDPGKEYTSRLLEYFLTPPERAQDIEIPEFLLHNTRGFDVNQAIDKEGNTTFHWACSMGDLKMCDALLNYGANYRCLNHEGQVPIMRAVLFTNSYARRTFAKLLDLLRDTLLDRDSRGRTILHHISTSSNSKIRMQAARYYLELLLAKVSEIQPLERLSNYINQQDMEGNTALHFFVLNGAKKCVKILLGYGARVDIPNEHGETVYDFLSTSSLVRPDLDSGSGIMTTSLDSVSQLQPFHAHNGASNFYTNNVPHYSETAMQINQKVSSLLSEKLHELSNVFDSELKQTEDELAESKQQLAKLEEDVSKTNVEIGLIVSRLQKGGDIQEINKRVTELSDTYTVKTAKLRSILARSQAKDLAQVVQKKESESDPQKLKEPIQMNLALMESILELCQLQISRKRKAEEIVTLYADASGESEKMNQYRRLVSLCCNVELDEVDGLLDGIVEALKNDKPQ